MSNEHFDDPDLETWDKFCRENPLAVTKAMIVFETLIARKYSIRPVFSVLLQALWMSCLVFTCMQTFAPFIGPVVAMVVGGIVCVLVERTMAHTSLLIIEWAQKRMFRKVRKVKKDGDSSSDRS